MPITEIPKQVSSSGEGAVHDLKAWATDNLQGQDCRWMRMLGAGSLIAGAAMLLLGNRRKAGLAAATVGTVLVMLEEPKNLAAAWAALPSCIKAGERFLDRVEGYIEQIATQGERVRTFIDRVPGIKG